MLTPLIAIAAITLIGFIAQHIGLCLVKATKETMQGHPGLLIAILSSGLWVWLYSIIALNNGWDIPLDRYAAHPMFALGGFIFGVGASINQGCSVSTMNHLARGNTSMLFTISGWVVGWCLWMNLKTHTAVSFNYTHLPDLPLLTVVLLSTPIFLITLSMLIFSRQQRSRWLGIALIGCLAGFLYYLVPSWSPSKLIQDSGSALIQGGPFPNLLRCTLVMMLLFGMWLSAARTRGLKLRWPTWHKVVRHSTAGTLMGVGSSMALGGNDTQLMMALPAGSIGGLTALLFMLLGITVEQTLYQKGKPSFFDPSS